MGGREPLKCGKNRRNRPGVAMSPEPITDNTLFYGDSLPIFREHFLAESVDLVYLDPPFNSNRSCNTLPKDKT